MNHIRYMSLVLRDKETTKYQNQEAIYPPITGQKRLAPPIYLPAQDESEQIAQMLFLPPQLNSHYSIHDLAIVKNDSQNSPSVSSTTSYHLQEISFNHRPALGPGATLFSLGPVDILR